MKTDRLIEYEGNDAVRAAAFLTKEASCSDAIDAALSYAREARCGTVIIDGENWLLDRAVCIPSHTQIIVDGVTVKLKNGVLDNIFRPDCMVMRPDDPYGFPVEIKKTFDIRVTGKNGARLEGPDENPEMYHPNQKTMQKTVGDYWGWRGFIAFFPRCSGFEFSGFTIRNTRSWAISAERSENGYIHDIDVVSDCKNGDGINLRVGTKRILIENIKAKTSDDCIAINSLGTRTRDYPDGNYVFPLIPSDYLVECGEPAEDRYIHDIFIRNVVSATDHYSQGVAFMTRQRHKIFRVYISGVYDANPAGTPKRIDMVGSYYMGGYGDIDLAPDDLSGIRIEDVVSNSTDSALLFRHEVRDVRASGVRQNCPEGAVLTALEENADEIKVTDSSSVSGKLFSSAREWKLRK